MDELNPKNRRQVIDVIYRRVFVSDYINEEDAPVWPMAQIREWVEQNTAMYAERVFELLDELFQGKEYPAWVQTFYEWWTEAHHMDQERLADFREEMWANLSGTEKE